MSLSTQIIFCKAFRCTADGPLVGISKDPDKVRQFSLISHSNLGIQGAKAL